MAGKKGEQMKAMDNQKTTARIVVFIMSLVLITGISGIDFAHAGSGVVDKISPVVNSITIYNPNSSSPLFIDAQGEMCFDIEITEEESGVGLITCTFINTKDENDSKFLTLYDCDRDGTPPLFSGKHTIRFSMPKYADNNPDNLFGDGSYELYSMAVWDEKGNDSFAELETVCEHKVIRVFNAEEYEPDLTAPVINSISFENIDQVERHGVLRATVDITEEGSGVSDIYLSVAEGEDEVDEYGFEIDNKDWYTCDCRILGNHSKYLHTGTYSVEWTMPSDISCGTHPFSISVEDRDGNSTSYPDEGNALEMPGEITVVESDNVDSTRPVVNSVSFHEESLVLPNVLNMDIDLVEEDSGVKQIDLEMRDENGNCAWFSVYNEKRWFTGTHQIKVPIGPFVENGTYHISLMHVWDDSEEDPYTGWPGTWYENPADYDDPLYPIENSPQISMTSPFDIAYSTSGFNTNGIIRAVESMDNGQVAVIDSRKCKIVPKRVFEAIAGKDILLVFQDDDVQWVFDGKKIEKTKCKDIDLTTRIYLKNGKPFGFIKDEPILIIDFMENGELPGETEVRINNAYISAKYTGGEDYLMQSYLKDGLAIVEDTDVAVDNDEAAVLKITHNSSHGITSKKNLVSISKATVKLSKASYTYNGKAKKPSVRKVIRKGKTLKSSAYSLKGYKNNKSAGKGKVLVKGNPKKGYTGTATGTFTIKKASNTLKVSGKSASVKFTALEKKSQALSTSKVFAFSNKGKGTRTFTKKSGSKYVSIAKSTGKVTVKKGLKKGTYKVKAKVKAKGNSNYKSSEKTVTITIKVK